MSYKKYADGLDKTQQVSFSFNSEGMGLGYLGQDKHTPGKERYFDIGGARVLDVVYYDPTGKELPHKGPSVPDDAQVGGVKATVDVMGKPVVIEAAYGQDRKDLKYETYLSRFDINSEIPYRVKKDVPGAKRGVDIIITFDPSLQSSEVIDTKSIDDQFGDDEIGEEEYERLKAEKEGDYESFHSDPHRQEWLGRESNEMSYKGQAEKMKKKANGPAAMAATMQSPWDLPRAVGVGLPPSVAYHAVSTPQGKTTITLLAPMQKMPVSDFLQWLDELGVGYIHGIAQELLDSAGITQQELEEAVNHDVEMMAPVSSAG